jgi:prokaryotic ubiquitin-like protein Pup
MAKDTGGGQQRHVRRDSGYEEAEPEAAAAEELADRMEQLDEDVDAMLDEIDEVLEENAEDFVRSFVQKGGE